MDRVAKPAERLEASDSFTVVDTQPDSNIQEMQKLKVSVPPPQAPHIM